jgi:glucuronate isomerase
MRKFMNQDFLLFNDTAKILYNNYAKEMLICDFHCHLSPKEIAEDKRYKNITELWLGGDHYKWRVLRSNGIDESFVTGNEKIQEFHAAIFGT